MHTRHLFFAVLFLFPTLIFSSNTLTIQPTPQSVEMKSGEIIKPASVKLIGKTNADVYVVQLLQSFFSETTSKKDFPVYIGERGNRDVQPYSSRIPARAEGYYLAIEKNKIVFLFKNDEKKRM